MTAPAARDGNPAAAESAAERLMAQYRLQQQVEASQVRAGSVIGRVASIAMLSLLGMFTGALLGALRGHAVTGALLMGLVAALLATVQTRPR